MANKPINQINKSVQSVHTFAISNSILKQIVNYVLKQVFSWLELTFKVEQCSKLKKSSGHLLATNWRNIVGRCKFLVASLYILNDAANTMAQSIRFDCFKISRTEVGKNLEVNWLCLCDLANFLGGKQSTIR